MYKIQMGANVINTIYKVRFWQNVVLDDLEEQ